MAVPSNVAGQPLHDREAFTAFYQAALPRVYGYLLARCGGIAWLAEELTQEAFVAAVADIKRGNAVADPIRWILGIAGNKFVDHVRRQEREAQRLAGVWAERQQSSDLEPP